jgi:hypothetical protein
MQDAALRPAGSAPAPPLLPRYRRPMSAGAVLDETFRIYRRAWRRLVGLTLLANLLAIAVAALAVGLVVLAILATAGQTLFAAFARMTRGLPPDPLPAGAIVGLGIGILLAALVGSALALAGQGGVCVLADGEMRDERRTIMQAFWAGLGRALALIGATLVYAVGLLVAFAAALVPFLVLRRWALVGILIALLALIGWAASRDLRRQPAVKWAIVLGTPFGLPVYLGVRWSLWLPAAVLDRAGPVLAVRRSHLLAGGHWFRVLFIWVVMAVVASILQAIPGAIAGALYAAAGGAAGWTVEGITDTLNVANTAGSYIGGVLFGSLPLIAAALMYVDLRNRREGTDLGERLDVLAEGAPAPG